MGAASGGWRAWRPLLYFTYSFQLPWSDDIASLMASGKWKAKQSAVVDINQMPDNDSSYKNGYDYD